MKNQSVLLARRSVLRIVPLGVAGAILLRSEPAEARILGIIIRIAGYSAGSLSGLGLVAGMLALGGIASVNHGLHSMFQRSTRSSSEGNLSYSTDSPSGWKKDTPPKPIIISVSFDPNERIAGDVLRIRAIEHDVLKNDGVLLPYGGRLIIEKDGTLIFADTKFRGYAYIQNNGDLSVWTPDHQHVLTRSLREGVFHNIHQDSDDGRLALVSLLGDIKHA